MSAFTETTTNTAGCYQRLQRLRAWIPSYAPVNRDLLEQWTVLPYNYQMMHFYNGKAMLCDRGSCALMPGWNALKAGLSTQ